MNKYNIFEMGDKNSDYLKSQYDLLKQTYQNSLQDLEAFVELIEKEWTISINMKLLAIHDLLVLGNYENVFEYYESIEEAFDIKISLDKALEIRLKSYKPKRMAFNSCFNDSERFKYGALNIGGLGISMYGEFCVVLKKSEIERYISLVFIKEDSLNEYVDTNYNVDYNRMSKDVANRDHVHFLVAIKHQGSIKTIQKHQWAQMICCNKQYVESIVQDDVINDHVEVVRISKEYHKRMYEILFDTVYKKTKSKIKAELFGKEFKLLKDVKILLKRKGIRLEVI